MKEIKDIIKAYQAASLLGKKTALATVVHVEGSSYRRPGARMLITEDGVLTGAISGGCLEGDALRKALLAINENRNKLVTYDTTDEDDAKFGVQLGCNGIVHILFEPIKEEVADNPIVLLAKVETKRKLAVLATLFSLDDKDLQVGTIHFYSDEEVIHAQPVDADPLNLAGMQQDLAAAFSTQLSCFKVYAVGAKNLSAFIEVLLPPIAIHIFGAGNDAIPLVEMSNILGWELTIVDGRRTHATVDRFPQATRISIEKAETALKGLMVDGRTATVLMTHNYNYDIEVLRQLIETRCSYIGILGPKKKLHRMIEELAASGTIVSEEQQVRIYSPIGLDIGAETAEEIALSISAEIKAVFTAKNAMMLRDKQNSIHH
jgi:xanthine dehydrogenase accessory factor